MKRALILFATVLVIFAIAAFVWLWRPINITQTDIGSGARRVKVEFSGGHETDPVDHGRPVVLIAAALGVKPEVFREAFSRVRPAPAGTAPGGERVRENKAALMQALGPHGITNERLDTVSNYYRYNASRGELWPTKPAAAYAIVENGKIARFEVTNGGSGYSSPPVVSVPGFPNLAAEVQLSFGLQFENNGSVSTLTLLHEGNN